jgi:hypothetical protein
VLDGAVELAVAAAITDPATLDTQTRAGLSHATRLVDAHVGLQRSGKTAAHLIAGARNTAIVAIAEDDVAALIADSAALTDANLERRLGLAVRRNGSTAIGLHQSTPFATGALITCQETAASVGHETALIGRALCHAARPGIAYIAGIIQRGIDVPIQTAAGVTDLSVPGIDVVGPRRIERVRLDVATFAIGTRAEKHRKAQRYSTH